MPGKGYALPCHGAYSVSLHIAHCVVLTICPAQGDRIERLFSFTHVRTPADSPIKLTRPST